MNEWKEYKLGELTDWFSGGTPSKDNAEYWQGKIPWISAKTMTWHKISTSDLNISDAGLKNGSRLANVDDILLLVRGSGLFNDIPICLIDKPVSFNQDIKAIRAKDFKYQEFIYYWLHGNKKGLYDILEETGIGAGKFDTELLKNLEISIPLIDSERELITTISRSIFDKIDLMHRQNATLEKMAETLFRQWFVEEAKEEWEEGTLDDILTVKGGTTPSTAEPAYWNGIIHWTSPRDITNLNGIYLLDTERKITELGLSKISSGLLPKGTLLMSSRAPVGVLAFSEVPVAINQGYIAILDNKGYSKEFIYLWLKINIDVVHSFSNGSTFMEISKSAFKTMQLQIPPKQVISDFQILVKPLFEKIKSNQIQIRTLTALRDTLLPKLMSGEVRVEMKK